MVFRKTIISQGEKPVAVAFLRVDIEEICLWIEAGGHPVGGAVSRAFDKSPIGVRLFCRVGNGTSIGVNAFGKVDLDVGTRKKIFPSLPVKDKEVAIAACLGNEPAWFAVEICVEKNRGFNGIPVVGVMRRCLE